VIAVKRPLGLDGSAAARQAVLLPLADFVGQRVIVIKRLGADRWRSATL
jgi:hypothetical protein